VCSSSSRKVVVCRLKRMPASFGITCVISACLLGVDLQD
jgi:hypothetical protein